MTWGSWGKQLSTSQMTSLIDFCKDSAITSFDHADIYGDYGNEEAFGNAFRHSKAKREEVEFISKCGIQFITKARPNKVKHYNYSKDYIIWSAERSLKKLKTDYLDLFLLHRPSPLMQPGEIAEAVQRLQKDGKIRQFGVSNFSSSQIALLESAIRIDANQVEFSLYRHEVMYDGTLDDCMINNRTAMAWSPLGNFFREDDKRKKRINKVMDDLQLKYNASASQLLLAWIHKHPSKIIPVVGTTVMDRLESSARAHEINLSLEDWFDLLTASQGHEVP